MIDEFGGLTGWDFEGFHTGADTEIWKRLGAHHMTITDDLGNEISGTRFAVWAPNAQRVQVRGTWNNWDGAWGEMSLIPGSGIWGKFVPDVSPGAIYKFHIQTKDGSWLEKVDPVATFAEQAPANGSIVYKSEYVWDDQDWMQRRHQAKPWQEPMSIYEVHPGSWRPGSTYLDLAEELVAYVVEHGFTHVEFMPVAEHPFEPSWGYQVTNYFAPQSRLGRPDDFRHLVDALHQAGIGVIMDWVPGHFPKDAWALGRFDGTALYEHADPRQGEHRDWGTYIFNYGRNEVKSFLVSNALYWAQEFHVDGLRVDAVASMLYLDYSRHAGEWVPNTYGGNANLEAIDFLRYVNKHLYEREPGFLMIAEESTSWNGVTQDIDQGGLGFGFKWNMGWMNDNLRYLNLDPVYRKWHHNDITFAGVYAFTENFILPISHDEVVHGKGSMINKIPQDYWRKFATLRAFFAYMWSFPGKQLVFMGSEFAQWAEFNESAGLDWALSDMHFHRGLRHQFKKMNELYKKHPALWRLDNSPQGFSWIQANDADHSVFAWVRYDGQGEEIACVVNFSAAPYDHYRLELPHAGQWQQILNTDASEFDGDTLWNNPEVIIAEPQESERWPAQANIKIPPLGALWLRHCAKDSYE